MPAKSLAAFFRRRVFVRPSITPWGLARWLVVASFSALASTPSFADLTGTTVQGSMIFGGNAVNCFATGGCDSIAGSGDTAVVGAGVEFSWPGFNFATTANVGPSTLDVNFNPTRCCSAPFNTITFSFKDAAFTGGSVSLNSFGGFPSSSFFTFGLVGDTITIQTLPGLTTAGSPYSLRLDVATVPEPSVTALVLAGLLMIGYAAARRSGRIIPALRATA